MHHSAGKVNRPDPTNVHFLFENPRFENEPVCHASTKATRSKQHHWWPSKVPAEVKLIPPAHSLNTTNRSAFGLLKERPEGLGRFTCVEGKRKVAFGIVPITDFPINYVKSEKISYGHSFDSRGERRQRGKLHGSFVWDTTYDMQKPRRRFAKEYSIVPDSVDMSGDNVPKQTVINTTSAHHQTGTSSIPTSENPQYPVPQQVEAPTGLENQVVPIRKESSPSTISEKEDKPILNPVKTHLKPRDGVRFSPPPHLC